jgi:hypothetical protein
MAKLRPIGPILALLLLNAVFSSGDVVESPLAWLPGAVGIETILLVGALAAWAARRRAPPGALWALAILLFVLLALRLIDLAIPWYFGRDFSLASDIRFIPFALGLLWSTLPAATFVAGAFVVAVAAVGTVALLRMLLTVIWREAAEARAGAAANAAALAMLGWFVVPAAPSAEAPRPPVSADTVAMLARQTNGVLNVLGWRNDYRARIEAARAARAQNRDLARLQRRNVLLVFIESYGAVTFTDRDFAARLDPVRTRMAAALQARGFAIASDMVRAPITGGGSWLAHTTMLAGLVVDGQALFEVLIAGENRTLAHDFAAAGYRSIAAMPRIDLPWPEGRLLGFDPILLQQDFGYRGPRYAWETLPDQYVLDRLRRTAFAQTDRPHFAKIVLASSHTPFERVPPLVEDWAALGDGAIYHRLPARETPGRLFENVTGYLATTEYVLDALARFVAERIEDDTMVIVLGDHQPPLTVARDGRDRSVPIHVISRAPDLVAPFRARGFADGMTPARMTADWGMEEFLERFIADFSSGGVRQAQR